MTVVRQTVPLDGVIMSEAIEAEAEEIIEAEATDTSTETDDADSTAPETTDESDADSETALEAEADPAVKELEEKLAKAEKKLARTSYEGREARRQQERLISVLESQKTPPEAKAPQVEDFETLDDYVDARFEYLSKSNEAKAEPAPQGVDPAFNQSRDDLFFEGEGKYPDFVEKVRSDSMQLTPFMANAIFDNEDMDMQVELAYSLANNPREASRISRLSPMRQAAEIGKLEIKLSTPTPAKKQPSTAPKPVKPVGGAKTTSTEMQEGEDFKTFLKKRNKQLGR